MEKDQLVAYCREKLLEMVADCRSSLAALQEDLLSESKSTAGDKHETGRAMLHLEVEKETHRLKETETMLAQWDRIDFKQSYKNVQPGALILTNKGYFINAVPFGRIDWNGTTVQVLSPVSPLMKGMAGKGAGDCLELPQQTYVIISVA